MATEMQGEGLVVLEPVAEPRAAEARLVPRLDSLDGKVVGFLDNSKPNADRFLALMERELSQRYRLAGIVRARKPGASHVCPEEILADLSRCDAVITAMGD